MVWPLLPIIYARYEVVRHPQGFNEKAQGVRNANVHS